jgi:hypothetical protein
MGDWERIMLHDYVTPEGDIVAVTHSSAHPFDSTLTPEAVAEQMIKRMLGKDLPRPGMENSYFRDTDRRVGVRLEAILSEWRDMRAKLLDPDGKINEKLLDDLAAEYGSDRDAVLKTLKLRIQVLESVLLKVYQQDQDGQYVLKPMKPEYVKKDKDNGVEYWKPGSAELKKARLTFKDGLAYDADGKLFDTTGLLTDGHQGEVIYIMDKDGNFYVAEGRVGRIHHSTLGDGEPVAAAGHIRIENGVVKLVNNNSGHYAPEDYYLEQADKRLRELGVDTAGVVKRFK